MVSAESQAAMDAAKKAVMEFMSKNGRHDTTVHERVAPAVYHETIARTEKEELVTLVDREITQDHYHTSVQPITDSETLEEQHHHNLLPVENRITEHDDAADRDLRLAAEMSKFKDEILHVDGEHTQTVVPLVAAEHIHRHVHEIIQPVVNKHTIEPHVIHTTVQIHEKVHNTSKHHTMSALPLVTMVDFKKQGGVLVGREERWDSFDGEPRSVGGNLGTLNTNAPVGASTEHNSTHPTTPSAPERRSSIGPQQRRASVGPAEKPTAPSTDKPLPTPSAAAMTDASKVSETPSQPQSAPRPSQPNQAQPSQGRFSLLPMNLARSAGSPQMGHQPIQVPLRATPTPTDTRQASVVTRPGEQRPAGQDQQQPGRPS